MHEPFISVTGNVGALPRTRVVASGAVVTDFRIAHTPRKVDRATGAWADGVTIWFGVSCWRNLAENVAASLKTGDRVVVTGRLLARTWKNDKGEERSGLEIDAQTVAFDLSRGKAVQERPAPMVVTSDPGQPVPSEEDFDLDRELDDEHRDDEHRDDDLSIGDPSAVPASAAA